MITSVVQRWRDRRDSYRPVGETIQTSRYEVASIADDTTPRSFIEQHHYSGTYPAARRRYGLYRAEGLVGVAVFSQPVNNLTLAVLGCPGAGIELGRFVLLDEVPANGETWFLARCFELLHSDGLEGVVSFADPVARTSVDGATVFAGHIGTIYQAFNAVYVGRGSANTIKMLPNGRVLSPRAIQKIRAGEQGWRYAVAQLEAAGAEPLTGDRRAWLATWLPRVTRSLRHPGNHKYAWRLSKRGRRALPASLPYPKFSRRAA